MVRLRILLITFFFFIAIITSKSEAKIHVEISNALGPNVDLTVHCKSKDNNLGYHLLHYQNVYGFHFGRNYFGSTLFFCSFQWDLGGNQFHHFDIYKEIRDECTYCFWNVRPSGPCLFNFKHHTESCFGWNKNAAMAREFDKATGD